MKEILQILSWAVLILYGISFWHYYLYFKDAAIKTAKRTRVWFGTTTAMHTLYLVVLSLELEHLPVGNLYQFLTSFAWLVSVVYLSLEVRLKEMTIGVFLLPIALVLQGFSCFLLDVEQPLASVLTNLLFEFHVSTLISAYAAFTISFITSIMYMLLLREMRSKELGIFFQRLPSLDFFDSISNHAVNIGLVLISIGSILGIRMGLDVWGEYWYTEPKFLALIVSWLIYFLHFITRKSIGWQGKYTAVISIVGFNWLFFSFILVNVFFSKFHKFL